jgi:hypothetical protein
MSMTAAGSDFVLQVVSALEGVSHPVIESQLEMALS